MAVAAWRSDPYEAVILGPAAVFALVSVTCYYWIILIAIPLRGDRWTIPVLLGLNTALYWLHLVTPAFEMIYGVMSWMLTVFFIVWTVDIIRRQIKSRSDLVNA